MTDMHDWSSQLEITREDLNRVAGGLELDETPQELKTIALRLIRACIEQGSGNVDEQVESVLVKHGERILGRLAEKMQADPRFMGLEGKWFLTDKLPRIDSDAIR